MLLIFEVTHTHWEKWTTVQRHLLDIAILPLYKVRSVMENDEIRKRCCWQAEAQHANVQAVIHSGPHLSSILVFTCLYPCF